jgi:hypothetical protein
MTEDSSGCDRSIDTQPRLENRTAQTHMSEADK